MNDIWCAGREPIYGHEDDTTGTLQDLENYMDQYTKRCMKNTKNAKNTKKEQ